MGRKIHPIGFRLKVIRDWDARWYAEGDRYQGLLQEDFKIRRFIKGSNKRAGISRIEIERYPNQLVINIHTARPGIVIGRKGEAVKQMRADLEKLTDGKKVKVEVSEIEKADTDALLVAPSGTFPKSPINPSRPVPFAFPISREK
jgi:small subunit ribosomal protein S3